MSNVYLISDLHLGHKRILSFEPNYRFGDTVEEHNHILIERIKSVVKKKRDTLIMLGDICFNIELMPMLDEIPGDKILVRGNHDSFDDGVYRKYFKKVHGILNYKGFWLTHAPIHPTELRGRKNIHGHVHSNCIRDHYHNIDKRYINVCVENCEGYPVNFQDIKDGSFKGAISR